MGNAGSAPSPRGGNEDDGDTGVPEGKGENDVTNAPGASYKGMRLI